MILIPCTTMDLVTSLGLPVAAMDMMFVWRLNQHDNICMLY
jgi:hypothetical protein